MAGAARLHTPHMSLRKKSLFERAGAGGGGGGASEEEWEAESLGALGLAALDSSSSGDEREAPQPHAWRETRSRTRRMLKEAQDLNDFIKSPYTLRNYASRHHESRRLSSLSVPATPHFHRLPDTPSSSHSSNSIRTTASDSCRARKSLASLIAETESCSSSLKDLNFDSDSGTDTKENTPTKVTRKSTRRRTMTPKFASFKGILSEHKRNVTSSPMTGVTVLEKDAISPTQMLKTPHNMSEVASPPKLSHRRTILEIDESPEETENRNKRHWNDSLGSDTGPNPKNPKLDTSTVVPKARLSLFNSDKLKEILTTKSFYPKKTVEVSPTVATKISKVISTTHRSQPRHNRGRSHGRTNRKPGEINMGVRHRIRKPKASKYRQMISLFVKKPAVQPATANVNTTSSNVSFSSQNTSQNITSDLLYDREKGDPFAKEHVTIDNLLSQWDEEEVPSTEPNLNQSLEEANAKIRKAKTLLCFNKSVIEENNTLLNPNAAVAVEKSDYTHNSDSIIMELGATINGNALSVKETSSNAKSIDNLGPIHITDIDNNSNQFTGTAAEVDENASVKETASHFNGHPVKVYGNTSKVNVTTLHVNETGSQVHGEDVEMSGDEVESHEMVNGSMPKTEQFLPVEGGYLLVDEARMEGSEEELTDLDAIERELAMLDDQLCSIAKRNNIDPELILAPTDAPLIHDVTTEPRVPTSPSTSSATRLFPIFSKTPAAPAAPAAPVTSKGASQRASKRAIIKTGLDQYVIDAGQKRFGATQCTECGVVYQIGDPQDENDHLLYHNAVDVLRFPGWKEERVVGVYDQSRCVCVRGADPHWRKVSTLLERVVHPQLGYAASLPIGSKLYAYTAYLYICKKQIIGCLVAEPKQKAHKLITGEVDCISTEEYPVKCGVSRLWTHLSHRRRSVATSLLNCMRASFMYGHVLDVDEIAFSAPTPAGKAFATKYTGASNFFVYLD